MNNNNIIFSNLDFNLLILIKIFFFQEELKNKLNTQEQFPTNTYILIDKEFISKFKNNFNYDDLYNYMKKEYSKNELQITESVDNENIFEIIQNLPRYYINSIKNKMELNKFNYQSDKKIINGKIVKSNQDKKNLKYINNFEIINANIFLKLSNINKKINNFCYYGRIYCIKNKLLIVFKDKETNSFYFEIGYINEINSYIVEYIIDILYDKNIFKEISHFDNYFNEINKKIIYNYIYDCDKISIENNFYYFYKISDEYDTIKRFILIKELNKIKEELNNEKNKNKQLSDEVSLNKNGIKEEKDKNKKLSEEISLIKNEIKEEKDKNKKLSEEISLHKNEIKEEKDKNKKLLEEITLYKNELNEEKNKNKKLSEEISLCKNELKENKNKIINLEKTVNDLKKELEDNIKKYKDFEERTKEDLKNYNLIKSKEAALNAILERDKEIKELKQKLSRYPFELNEGEELMTVNISSVDQELQNYTIICKDTVIFSALEKKLYEDIKNKKDYYSTENFFTVNGNKINKSKSLKENNIHNHDSIILNVIE